MKLALLGLSLATALLWLTSRALLNTNFLPHWYCFLGNQRLLWSNVITDLVIGLSYVVISSTLAWLVRRAGPDLPYPYFFWAFGVFIVSCGATHFMEVITVWKPVYWLSAAVKIVTAAASAGTAAVLLFAADDIVEFVRTAREAAARRGNEQFRAVIQATPMPVMSTDLEDRVTAWNPAAERVFGWRAEEVLGRKPFFVPPDKRQERAAIRERAAAGEVTASLETVRIKCSGERFPVSVSTAPLYDENGALSGIMGVIEDITERKRIDFELREKTAVLTTVTHALNTFLDLGDWSAASQHLLTFVLQQTQSEYGFLGVVLEGPVLRVLAHQGFSWDPQINSEICEGKIRQHTAHGYFEVSHHHNLLGEVILKGQTVVSNSCETDPRSGGIPAGPSPLDSFLGVPIFKGNDTVGLIAVANRPDGYSEQQVGYLEAMSQATGVLYDNYRQSLKRSALEKEQQRLESQVRQAQKMEVLGRLAGGIAHDFNNMLMVLSGCTELLDRSLSPESPARSYLDQIQRTTDKAASMTRQLLAFSRKQVLENQPTDLHEILRESEFMLPRLLGADVQLTFRYDAAKFWILSAPNQIEQVLANLAINARDAMPEGGQLFISTLNSGSVPRDSLHPREILGDWVVLEVRDTGTGFDEKTSAQLFEPFFTTKPAGKGTGLGLATVYGIVKQSGGHIRVISSLGKGACFQLYFPLVTAPVTQSAPVSPLETGGDTAGTTVLVVDDEASLRHAVVEILRSSGYTVLEAETARGAVEMASQHKGSLDVLLTDVVMPVMRGPEVARRISKLHPETRVIYMSGYADGLPEAQLPQDSAFLQKPFRFASLLEQLKLVRQKS